MGRGYCGAKGSGGGHGLSGGDRVWKARKIELKRDCVCVEIADST